MENLLMIYLMEMENIFETMEKNIKDYLKMV